MKSLYKIVAVLISVSLCFVVCSFPVSADTVGGASGNRDEQFTSYTTRYLTDVFEILKNSMQNGELTGEDCLKVSNLTKNYMDNTVKYATDSTINGFRDTLTSISDTLQNAVGGVSDGLREVADGLVYAGRNLLDYCGIDYGKTEVSEVNIDMRGCGAVILSLSNGSPYSSIYMDYGTLTPNGEYYTVTRVGMRYDYIYSSGKLIVYNGQTETSLIFPSDINTNFKLYGDWRWSDGTPADDKTTPIQNTIQTNDPSTLTDTQLIDLLEDLLLNLKLDYPDLSSVEGLLSAILTKLGTLDSDNDNGLLSDIYVAIQSLKTDDHSESQQIIAILEEIRDNLTGTSSGSGETSDLTELTEILKDMKKSLNYLVGLETVDVAADIIDLANIEFSELDNKFFNKYASLINTVINKFGYGPVDAMLKTCQAIVFNTSAPSDLSINYNGNDYTILSTSMFENEDVKKSLDLVKTFISIFILIGWLTIMRKRITSTE